MPPFLAWPARRSGGGGARPRGRPVLGVAGLLFGRPRGGRRERRPEARRRGPLLLPRGRRRRREHGGLVQGPTLARIRRGDVALGPARQQFELRRLLGHLEVPERLGGRLEGRRVLLAARRHGRSRFWRRRAGRLTEDGAAAARGRRRGGLLNGAPGCSAEAWSRAPGAGGRKSGRFGAASGLLDASQSGFTQQVGRQAATASTRTGP